MPQAGSSPRDPTCRTCDLTMRLFGIEAHPTIKRAELHTYLCPRCDAVETQMAPIAEGVLRIVPRARQRLN